MRDGDLDLTIERSDYRINRFLFVGVGSLGANAVFDLKRRLLRINAPKRGPLLCNDSTKELTLNPYQFLLLPETITGRTWDDARWNLLRHFNFTGSDTSLFFPHEEVLFGSTPNRKGKEPSPAPAEEGGPEEAVDLPADAEPDAIPLPPELETTEEKPSEEPEVSEIRIKRIAKAYQEALRRLTNHQRGKFRERTGIDVSIFPPLVLLVMDIDDWRKQEWRQVLQPILQPTDQEIINLNIPIAAIVFANRNQADFAELKSLTPAVRSLFLFDRESDRLLYMPDDAIDLAVNMAHVLAMCDGEVFQNFFVNAQEQTAYSFGATYLYYPRADIIVEAVQKCLGHPEYNFQHGLGERFLREFIGVFVPVDVATSRAFFLAEDADSSNYSGDANELHPQVRDANVAYAATLCQQALTWMDTHIENLKEMMEIESIVKRIKELTNHLRFWGLLLEQWAGSLDAFEFLMDYEVLKVAKRRAVQAKEKVYQDWESEVETTFKLAKIRRSDAAPHIEADENAQEVVAPDEQEEEELVDIMLSEHQGELAWETTRQFVAQAKMKIEEVKKERERTKRVTEYAKKKPPTKSEVEKAIDAIPRPLAFLSRLLLLVVTMVVFWPAAHELILIKWLGWSESPVWLSGLLFTLTLLVLILWLSYGDKIIKLRHKLKEYLLEQEEKWIDYIIEMETNLIQEFLFQATKHVRDNYAARNRFFLMLEQGNYKGIDNPNLTERYYLNRYYLYYRLQTELQKLRERIHMGVLCERVPDPTDAEYLALVASLAERTSLMGNLLQNPQVNKSLQAIDLWNSLLSRTRDPESESLNDEFCRTVISKCGWRMEDDLNVHPDFVNFRDLEAFLNYKRYQVSRDIWGELQQKAQTTFKLPPTMDPQIHVVAGSHDFFSREQRVALQTGFDHNCFIFYGLQGPIMLEDINWGER
ncbi:MAG TPA: hypothetical protein PKW95_20660 [bacterium]|nr:hypothetical protein [bacterium]